MDGIDEAICDYMVVAEGNTPTQVEAILDSISIKTKEELQERPHHVHVGSEWIIMDSLRYYRAYLCATLRLSQY